MKESHFNDENSLRERRRRWQKNTSGGEEDGGRTFQGGEED
jgi:hypothetical protein